MEVFDPLLLNSIYNVSMIQVFRKDLKETRKIDVFFLNFRFFFVTFAFDSSIEIVVEMSFI